MYERPRPDPRAPLTPVPSTLREYVAYAWRRWLKRQAYARWLEWRKVGPAPHHTARRVPRNY